MFLFFPLWKTYKTHATWISSSSSGIYAESCYEEWASQTAIFPVCPIIAAFHFCKSSFQSMMGTGYVFIVRNTLAPHCPSAQSTLPSPAGHLPSEPPSLQHPWFSLQGSALFLDFEDLCLHPFCFSSLLFLFVLCLVSESILCICIGPPLKKKKETVSGETK